MTREEFVEFVRDMFEDGYKAGANDWDTDTNKNMHAPDHIEAVRTLQARVARAISITAAQTAARFWDTHNTERN